MLLEILKKFILHESYVVTAANNQLLEERILYESLLLIILFLVMQFNKKMFLTVATIVLYTYAFTQAQVLI